MDFDRARRDVWNFNDNREFHMRLLHNPVKSHFDRMDINTETFLLNLDARVRARQVESPSLRSGECDRDWMGK